MSITIFLHEDLSDGFAQIHKINRKYTVTLFTKPDDFTYFDYLNKLEAYVKVSDIIKADLLNV